MLEPGQTLGANLAADVARDAAITFEFVALIENRLTAEAQVAGAASRCAETMQHIAEGRVLLERDHELCPAAGLDRFAEELPARLADEPVERGVGFAARAINREPEVLVLLPIEIGS